MTAARQGLPCPVDTGEADSGGRVSNRERSADGNPAAPIADRSAGKARWFDICERSSPTTYLRTVNRMRRGVRRSELDYPEADEADGGGFDQQQARPC
jgi:hypothetical protein